MFAYPSFCFFPTQYGSRTTSTGKATKKAAKYKAENEGNISKEQFAKMKSYGTFVVSDPDTGEAAYKFKRGDIAAILPHGRDPGEELDLSNYWVGVIKDIRALILDDDMNTVWAKVNWYYSGQDVKNAIKSFDQSAIGNYERIQAEHEDIVGSESFESVLNLIKFNEHDPEQAFIPRDHFYYRYSFELRARTVKPKPGSSGCTCLKPYDPNDLNPSRAMHFCPRPSCRKAYHQDCLLDAKSIETSPPVPKASTSSQKPAKKPEQTRRSARKHASPVKKPVPSRLTSKVTFEEADVEPNASSTSTNSRALRLLACSPDTDDPVDLEFLVPLTMISVGPSTSQRDAEADEDSDTIVAQPPKKKRRGPGRPPSSRKVPSSSQAQNQIQEPRSLASVLSEIPSDLLEIAQQPMVRGGAFIKGGVSGNIGFVTRARRLVYKILEGEKGIAEMTQRVDVPLNVNVNGSKSTNGGSGGVSGNLNMMKWEEEVFGADRREGFDVDEENAIVRIAGSRKTLPALVCPHCRSVI
ncbi:hypothetical protein CPB84DRAFT_1765103 [Gymnopilus junonius]|uniref:BAH domain-containing protein n=1 Tax=Gymnopilus junonius TaxID=109634 RepID=A0A9P5NZW7_GYMJU|nr:hypothetical protein CPB84DRAFT_1765103 [Gymnopilus junonius]